ncbi:MAG: hypothetical protein IJ302_03440, partial [Clostridia bacterium]|nr:hypothetical protein [Clostridia bacterium]
APSSARAVDAEGVVRRRMPAGEPETADVQPIDASVMRMSVLSNSAASIIAASDGWMTLSYAGIALTPQETDPTCLSPAVYCLHTAAGKVYTPCLRMADPAETEGVTFTFREKEGALIWRAAYPDETECTLSVTVDAASAAFAFSVSLVRHGKTLPFVLTFFFRPVLYAPYAYAAHTTFADLFLHTAVQGQTLTVRRRPRSEGETERVLLIHAGGLDSLHFVTDAGHLLPMGYSAQDCRALAKRSVPGGKGNNGSALVPIVYLRGRAVGGEAAVMLQHGNREPSWNPALLSSIRAEQRMLCGGFSALQSRVSVLLEAICGSRKTRLFRAASAAGSSTGGGYGKERYWKYGISGDLPVIALHVDDTEAAHSYAAEMLSAWKYLLLCGIRCDLLLCVTETDAYGQPQTSWIQEETDRQGLRFFREAGAGGGAIHVCRSADAQAEGLLVSAAAVLGGSQTEAVLPELPKMHLPAAWRGELSYTIDRRRIVIDKGRQQVPWSYLLTNGVFGALLTVNTLGFSFFTNSRECRVTPWYGDPLSERSGELLLLRFGGESGWHDLCRESLSVIIMRDAVHYLGILGTLSYRVTVTLPDRMKHKRIELYLKNDGITPLPVRVRYQAEPLFGALP